MDEEIEVKYLLSNFGDLEARLEILGARLTQGRVLETNLRLDTADMTLSARVQVLRLRKDNRATLTFKGPGVLKDGVINRVEIEVEVSEFETTLRLFEALGYHVFLTYEKYRRNYLLDGVTISLDEMPYGLFVELEGPSAEKVRGMTDLLDLDWDQRVNISYTALFNRVKELRGWTMRDLSFEAFRGLQVYPDDLGLAFADAHEVDI